MLIRNALIVARPGTTQQDNSPPFFGWVRVRGKTIAAMGAHGTDAGPDAPGEQVLDARGGALIPGLVNTHAHSHSSLTRGSAEGMALEAWLKAIQREQVRLTPDDVYVGALATYAECLLSGTTTVMDMCLYPEAAMRAAKELGIRAIIAPYVADSLPFAPTLGQTEALLGLPKHERVSAWVGLHDLESASDARIVEGVALARAYGVGVHMHCAESRAWTDKTLARTGRSPIAHLAQLGVLSVPAHLAHCVWADEHDQALLSQHGSTVAHCPHPNLKLGSGIAPVVAMRRAGVRVTLATDGAKANNRLDMFDVMKFASLLAKGAARDPELLTPDEVLGMATGVGAAALGLPARVIAPGAPADLTLVSVEQFHLQPAVPETITANLVHAARGSDVEAVIIDGELVVADGRLTRCDQAAILGELKRVGRALL
jgi:5-methylthioadenosine/S-adenosylhomocysteine deaminase